MARGSAESKGTNDLRFYAWAFEDSLGFIKIGVETQSFGYNLSHKAEIKISRLGYGLRGLETGSPIT